MRALTGWQQGGERAMSGLPHWLVALASFLLPSLGRPPTRARDQRQGRAGPPVYPPAPMGYRETLEEGAPGGGCWGPSWCAGDAVWGAGAL